MRRTDREITDHEEILAILTRGKVCHLALIDGTEPYVVALSYGVDPDGEMPVFYFHCAREGKKIDCIRANPAGCLVIDIGHELVTGERGCDWGMKYSSVVARGRLEFVDTPDEKKKGLDLLMKQYSGRSGFSYDSKVFEMTTVLKMTAREITGKRKA
jgi:nitroimidazol reductase NimA-like FMN-containing flavoprotein (pyridoxamine 5'-phosphate oxidase superfamily)